MDKEGLYNLVRILRIWLVIASLILTNLSAPMPAQDLTQKGGTKMYSQIGTKFESIINALKTAIDTKKPVAMDAFAVTDLQRQLTQIGKMSEKLADWLGLADGNPHFGKLYAKEIEASLFRIFNGQTKTIELLTDGTAAFGGDLDDPAKTSLKIFSSDQTYNGEAVTAGDLLIGDNSAGVPNLFWDESVPALYLRQGTTNVSSITGSAAFSNIDCSVRNTTEQSIPNNTLTVIEFDDELYDTGGFHSTTTNTSRLTIPQDGVYQITGWASFWFHATGVRVLDLKVNGVVEIGLDIRMAVTATDWPTTMTGTVELELEAGDYVEVAVQQTSGAARNVWGRAIIRRVR